MKKGVWKKEDERYMRMAIREALKAKGRSQAYGAVIVKNGKLIAKTHATQKDSTTHAEMNAIIKAQKKLGSDLKACTIIATHEPCPMCSGAIIWAKIREVVYGSSIKETKKLGRTRIDISSKEIFRKAPWKIRVKGGILKKQCLELYK